MRIDRFEDIEGWQLGRELTKKIYAFSGRGEFARDRSLQDQIRRASVSVMSNIAEGFDGGSDSEFKRFLHYSQRSCSEVQSQLYVALDQGYVSAHEFQELYDAAGRGRDVIGGFIKYLVNSSGGHRPSSEHPRPLRPGHRDT